MKRILSIAFVFATLLVSGQNKPSLADYIVDRFVDSTGREVVKIIVPGRPPDKYREPVAVPTRSTVSLGNVPAYDWSFGCSATSAAMMAGYYDRTTYPNMYAGPTNGGVAPMDNSVWGSVVINGETRKQCPISATRNTVDGRTTRGHVDDYWILYGSTNPDPFITNGWTEHTYGDCTGDYMKTNQYNYGNTDGSTTFYNYLDGSPYSGPGNSNDDGMWGLQQFFVSRGYTVTSAFNQYIYGYDGNTLGFTFAQYKAQINAGRPVLIQVEGHTMLGMGYDDTGNTVYLHDTWDYSTHTMTWGGTYSGMLHYAVGVVQLQAVTVDPCANIFTIGGCSSGYAQTYTGGGTGVWFNSSSNPCGYTTPGTEQVYSFVAPTTGTYSIQVTAASGYVDYLWKTSSCSSTGWTCIDDIYTAGQYGAMSWTAGTTYYILLDDEDNTVGTHTFYINCPIICVDCPTFDYSISPTTSWQTSSSSHIANGCKMYRVSVTSGQPYIFKTGCGNGATANYDTYLELYNAGCTFIVSDDDDCESNRSIIEWTANFTGYAYLKVRGFSSNFGNYTLAYINCTTPAQPGTISGNTSPCQGSSQVYSIAAVTGATSYTWSLPTGWTGSSTTTSITATVGSTGGTISVIANNACGSGSARTLSVSVSTVPAQPGTISGPASVNEGSTNTYSISAVSGATSYTWTLPAGWSGSSTTTSINATAGASGGNINVKANNTCGPGPAQSKSVTVNPAVPTNLSLQNITIVNGQTICYDATQTITCAGSGTTFIVQNGGDLTLIAGQNILLLPGTLMQSGGYVLAYITTDDTYCGTKADAVVSTPPVEGNSQAESDLSGMTFKVFPNPTTGRFTLLLNEPPGEQPCYLQVTGLLGNQVISQRLEGSDHFEFDLSGQNPGIYIIRLITGERVETDKLVKQ